MADLPNCPNVVTNETEDKITNPTQSLEFSNQVEQPANEIEIGLPSQEFQEFELPQEEALEANPLGDVEQEVNRRATRNAAAIARLKIQDKSFSYRRRKT